MFPLINSPPYTLAYFDISAKISASAAAVAAASAVRRSLWKCSSADGCRAFSLVLPRSTLHLHAQGYSSKENTFGEPIPRPMCFKCC